MAMTGEPAGLGELVLRKRRELGARAKALPTWTPQPGPQRAFIECTAREILYGGSAGGGKTMALAALPLPWMRRRELLCLYLRRTVPELRDLKRKAEEIYQRGKAGKWAPACPEATFREDEGTWTFRWGKEVGATAIFGHCNDKNDWKRYVGQEYQIIAFDELTWFTEEQYDEICKRLRSSAPGLPRMVRATSNPGGPGHAWVFKRWGPWLDPEFQMPDEEIEWFDAAGERHVAGVRGLPTRIENGRRVPPAKSGQILHVAKIKDREVFSTEPFTFDGEPALTRTFIGAKLSDNPELLKEDPSYRAQLRQGSELRRRQLEDGDWLAKPAAGMYFKREWFKLVEPHEVPETLVRCRSWDKAATEPNPKNTDPDWTRGLLGGKCADGFYWLLDLKSLRSNPGDVTELMVQTAEEDGYEVRITVPQDPGAAGVQASSSDVRALEGYVVTAKKASVNKAARAEPAAKQAHPQSTGGIHGRFRIVKAPWTETVLSELESFDGVDNNGEHDDIVDTLSDLYDELKDVDLEEDYRPIKAGRRRW